MGRVPLLAVTNIQDSLLQLGGYHPIYGYYVFVNFLSPCSNYAIIHGKYRQHLFMLTCNSHFYLLPVSFNDIYIYVVYC